jgi:hypothetical protein
MAVVVGTADGLIQIHCLCIISKIGILICCPQMLIEVQVR